MVARRIKNETRKTFTKEFGNLDELAEELGIHQFMELPEEVTEQPGRTITMLSRSSQNKSAEQRKFRKDWLSGN